MSCVAEVSHKDKREHVLCPLDLASGGCWCLCVGVFLEEGIEAKMNWV